MFGSWHMNFYLFIVAYNAFFKLFLLATSMGWTYNNVLIPDKVERGKGIEASYFHHRTEDS